ncbi:MAG: hypothetical protein CMG44_02120 [Candidatus Marinimicrobia bacterium]|nr:hypothetical protein [Candidatus Neomarinimicrobiota bacterium]|tara:strand:+ start:12 stop:221 length:210 start_codon:yes stop_codon:yes gene_type:complete
MSNQLKNKLRLAFSVSLILAGIYTFIYSFFYGEPFDEYFYLGMIMIGGAVVHLKKIEESSKLSKRRKKK